MKTYTFNFKNAVKNTNPSKYNDPSKNIDNLILSNLKKTVPYLFNTPDEDIIYGEAIIPIEPKKTIDISITLPKKTRRAKKFDFTKYDDFAKAIEFFKNYRDTHDTYDFLLPDGTPVKMFADEIQIGYDLLPLTGFTKSMYDKLSKDTKKNIIDIYINISK